jgi:hypothetical protein
VNVADMFREAIKRRKKIHRYKEYGLARFIHEQF